MADRTVYITVRLDIHNPNKKEITDEDVQKVVSQTNYNFDDVGDFSVETEICGIND